MHTFAFDEVNHHPNGSSSIGRNHPSKIKKNSRAIGRENIPKSSQGFSITFSQVFQSIGGTFISLKKSVIDFHTEKKIADINVKVSNELKESIDFILNEKIPLEEDDDENKIENLIVFLKRIDEVLDEINTEIETINDQRKSARGVYRNNQLFLDIKSSTFNNTKEKILCIKEEVKKNIINEIQRISSRVDAFIHSLTPGMGLEEFVNCAFTLKTFTEEIVLIEDFFLPIEDIDSPESSLKTDLATVKQNLTAVKGQIEGLLNEAIEKRISNDLSEMEEALKELRLILDLKNPIKNGESNIDDRCSIFFSQSIGYDDFIIVSKSHQEPEERADSKLLPELFESLLKIVNDKLEQIKEDQHALDLINRTLKMVENSHYSRIKCSNLINKLNTNLTPTQQEKFQHQIYGIRCKHAEMIQMAVAEINDYLKTTLANAIKSKELPPIVFQRLLSAAQSRLEELRLVGEDNEIINILISSILDLRQEAECIPESTKKSTWKQARLKELDEQSAAKKKSMTVNQLNARQLTGEQIQRIPDKLMRQLASIQEAKKLTSTALTPRRMENNINIRKKRKATEMKMTCVSELLSAGVGAVVHMQGDRPTQEDAHLSFLLNFMVGEKNYQIPLYGIFDGHGGKDGASYLAEYLPAVLQSDLQKVLNESHSPEEQLAAIFNTLKILFEKLTQEYRKTSYLGGSTACTALIYEGMLIVANLGDTRAFINVNGVPIALSEDAGIGDKQRDKSIRKRGGSIVLHKKAMHLLDNTGTHVINMTHSACEKTFSSVNTRPKIVIFPLHLLPPGRKELVIACDGVFDVMSTVDAAENLYRDMLKCDSVEKTAKKMVQRAYHKGSTDNISALIVDLTEGC